MKVLLITTLAIVLTAAVYALIGFCVGKYYGRGETTTRKEVLSNVTSIDFKSVGKLVIDQSNNEEAQIETNSTYMSHVFSTVKGNTLEIQEEQNTLYNLFAWALPKPTYHIAVRDLNNLSISGTGNVEISELKALNLTIRARGLGKLDASLNIADTLSTDISGKRDVTLKGNAQNQQIETSGSVHYDALSLRTQTTTLVTSGTSKVNVNAQRKLSASASGTSHITYSGSPEVTQNLTGSGKLSPSSSK